MLHESGELKGKRGLRRSHRRRAAKISQNGIISMPIYLLDYFKNCGLLCALTLERNSQHVVVYPGNCSPGFMQFLRVSAFAVCVRYILYYGDDIKVVCQLYCHGPQSEILRNSQSIYLICYHKVDLIVHIVIFRQRSSNQIRYGIISIIPLKFSESTVKEIVCRREYKKGGDGTSNYAHARDVIQCLSS